jgi:uncharacterized SAM-binding protein YcdF (DUF218 family)
MSIDSATVEAVPRVHWLRRLFLALLVALLGAGGLALFHRPLLTGYARLFRVDDPSPSDAIILLLGGSTHRPDKAAELYRQGLAPRILLGREPENPFFPDDRSARIKTYLQGLGVPGDAIEILPGVVTSTRDEALRVREYLARHPARRLTVVTTAFHTRRARWIFRRVLADLNVDVRAAAATDPDFNESNWYRTEEGLILYINETIKSIYYYFNY